MQAALGMSAQHALGGVRLPAAAAVRTRRASPRHPVSAAASSGASTPEQLWSNSEGAAPRQLSIHELSQPVLRSHGSPASSSASATEIAQLSARASVAAVVETSAPPAPSVFSPASLATGGALAAAALLGSGIKSILDKPSRAYVQGPDGRAVRVADIPRQVIGCHLSQKTRMQVRRMAWRAMGQAYTARHVTGLPLKLQNEGSQRASGVHGMCRWCGELHLPGPYSTARAWARWGRSTTRGRRRASW